MPATEDRYDAYNPRTPEDEGPGATGYLALALAWLVPGLGHFLIGQRARGIVFFVTIHLLFALGLLFGGIRSIRPPEQPIWTYTQYLSGWQMLLANRAWTGFAADYLPPPNAQQSAKDREFEKSAPPPGPNGDLTARTGYTKDFIAANPPFAFHPKVHDMGSVYCGIAGMLNLLVMFDVLLRVTGSVREDPTAARRRRNAPPSAPQAGAAA